MSDSARPFVEVMWQERNLSASVVSIEVEDHDRLVDKVTVVVDDPNSIGAATVAEGQAIRVDLGWQSEHAVVFEGLISQTASERVEGRNRVTITAYDRSQAMNRQTRNRSWESGSLSSIIRQIVEPNGITIGEISLQPDPSFTADNRLEQRGQSDLQFLYELARRYRSRCFVEYNGGASKFYFLPEARLLAGEPMLTVHRCVMPEFTYSRVASASPAERTATTVDPRTGETRSSSSPAVPPPAPPVEGQDAFAAHVESAGQSGTLDGATTAAAEAPEQRDAQVRRTTVPGAPSDPARAQQEVQRDLTRAQGLRGEGLVMGNIHLRAKGKIHIDGLPPADAGDWYVEVARHVYRDRAFRTRFVVTR